MGECEYPGAVRELTGKNIDKVVFTYDVCGCGDLFDE
jgi:hypothetical protein